jgi:hypothetical protein
MNIRLICSNTCGAEEFNRIAANSVEEKELTVLWWVT